jgi:hypothetical protein
MTLLSGGRQAMASWPTMTVRPVNGAMSVAITMAGTTAGALASSWQKERPGLRAGALFALRAGVSERLSDHAVRRSKRCA